MAELKYKQDNIVVLDSVNLTRLLKIEKIALCNQPLQDGKLPLDKNGNPDYGVYIRIMSWDGECCGQIIDYSGDVFATTNVEKVMKFLLDNKANPYPPK